MNDQPMGIASNSPLAMRQRLAQVDALETSLAEAVSEQHTTVTLYRAGVFAALVLGLCVGIVLPF